MNNILMLFIFVPILSGVLLLLNFLLSPHRPDEAKVSAYECGFSPVYGQTRSTFQIHFYIVAMLFLVFDIELVLLLPVSVSLSAVSTFGFAVAVLFFLILTIGFVLEIGSGAISLKSDHNTTNNTSNPLPKYLRAHNQILFSIPIKQQFNTLF